MARQALKSKASCYLQLDCRRLARMHGSSPSPSFVTYLADYWERPSGRVVITIQADRVEATVGDLVPLAWPIQIVRTQLGEGRGSRWWWECPSCDRRCAVLYFRGATPPGCRVCMSLAYDSQSQGRMLRTIVANHKVYARLGWNPGRPDTWARPKGMWHRTLLKLTDRLGAGWGKLREELSGVI